LSYPSAILYDPKSCASIVGAFRPSSFYIITHEKGGSVIKSAYQYVDCGGVEVQIKKTLFYFSPENLDFNQCKGVDCFTFLEMFTYFYMYAAAQDTSPLIFTGLLSNRKHGGIYLVAMP
jgi:hypothetical protein